jgi:arginine-tRNA-protein transferase
MTSQPPQSVQNFFRTGPMPCPYLPNRVERNLFTELGGPGAGLTTIELHDQLTKAGFRRSHNVIYRPACPSCNACVPVRVPVDRFQPGKSLRRIWNKNADLTVRIVSPEVQPDHFELFQRYQKARYSGGDMAAMGYADYGAMIADTFGQTKLFEYRDPRGNLVAVCLTDFLTEGLSAVYSFFEPALHARGLGSFCVLSLIDHAAHAGLRHIYLGYWIAESRKMAYKTRFSPLEALGPDGWETLESISAPRGE